MWASQLPLRSRHPPTLMQHEIAYEWASPRDLDRRLPALVPLARVPLALWIRALLARTHLDELFPQFDDTSAAIGG